MGSGVDQPGLMAGGHGLDPGLHKYRKDLFLEGEADEKSHTDGSRAQNQPLAQFLQVLCERHFVVRHGYVLFE